MNKQNPQVATKQDLQNLVTKQEIKQAFADNLVEIKKVVKSAVEETDENINRLARQMMTKFDEVDQNFIEVRADIAEIKESLNETNKKLDITKSNHERRLDIVENRTVTLKNHMENGFKKKLA